MTEPTVTGPGYALIVARHTACHRPAGKYWIAGDDIYSGAPVGGQWERYPGGKGGCTCSPRPALPEGAELAAAIDAARHRAAREGWPDDQRRAVHSVPC